MWQYTHQMGPIQLIEEKEGEMQEPGLNFFCFVGEIERRVKGRDDGLRVSPLLTQAGAKELNACYVTES